MSLLPETPNPFRPENQLPALPPSSALLSAVEKFRIKYKEDYDRELESIDGWIKWCKENGDTHGMNFHQGKQSAHISLDITMQSLLSSLELIGKTL